MGYIRLLSRGTALVALIILLLAASVDASSPRPRPLKRSVHPSTLTLDIIPRNSGPLRSRDAPHDTILRHSDQFRLTLSAFEKTFHLHLRPNEHLLHPAARINYYRPGKDGGPSVLDFSEPLLPEDVRVYMGEVIHEDDTDDRLREDAAGGVMHSKTPLSRELGWAHIMVHDHGDVSKGLAPVYEGAFSVNGVIHHISKTEHYHRNKHFLNADIDTPEDDRDRSLVIFRDSDMMTPEEEAKVLAAVGSNVQAAGRSCSHDTLSFNTDTSQHPVLLAAAARRRSKQWFDVFGSKSVWSEDPTSSSLHKRDDTNPAGQNMTTNFLDHIGQTNGCSKTQKIVYMGVAADCEYTKHYGGVTNAKTNILNDWNGASVMYRTTFNVSLGIVALDVHFQECPQTPDSAFPWNIQCSTNTTLNDRLSIFSQWRGDKGGGDGAGLWHLMSGCPTGTEVGVAWLGQVCNVEASGQGENVVSGTAVSSATQTEWQVVAHEIGHNFGAIHDCASGCVLTDACCPLDTNTCDAKSNFLMSPVSSATEQAFSPCTVGNICSLMLSGATNMTCFQDLGNDRPTISLQMCGNGIVEPGEQCDPGVGKTSPCCDASSCRFINNAVCDPQSSDCCTDSCQFAPSTQVCRPALDAACDKAELCSGNSSTCPRDQTFPNGTACGPKGMGLACAKGMCTSPDMQCQTVGSSMGLQKACPKNVDPNPSCQVSCQSPNNARECITLQATLVDGSPCGYGGSCNAGKCQAGSLLDTAKAWYMSNLQIAIPVSVVAGIISLLLLWGLISSIYRCCTRRKARAPSRQFSNGPLQRLPSHPPQTEISAAYNGGAATHPAATYPAPSSRQQGWVDESRYNGQRF